MLGIKHRVGIKAPIEAVYKALSTIQGLAGWWTTDTSGEQAVGGNIIFRFVSPEGNELGKMNMLVHQLEENETVHWKCIEGPPEWIGSDIVFDIHTEEEYTILLFQQSNWAKLVVEPIAHCSMKWAVFLLSLKELVETGKGRPSPDDVKIDNWN